MKRPLVQLIAALAAASLVIVGCAPASAPAPTKAPAAPANPPTAAPAVPTKAPEPTKPAAAQADFPQKGKSLTIVIPFAAGGGSDLLIRTLSPLLEKDLGIPVVIVNKPGAATQVGTTDVVKSKPDGYTVGVATLITTPVTYMDAERKATYSRKDILPLVNLVVEDMVLTVKKDSPYKDIKDLVTAAKGTPAKVKIGTTGLMGIGHLTALQLQQEAGVQFGYVHFDGAGPAMTALLGDNIDATSTGAGTVLGQVKGGTLKVLGYLDSQQSKFFPEIKPIDAQGYKVVVPAAYGIIAPAGMPQGVVDVLTRSFKTALENQDVVQKFAELGFTPRFMDSAKFSSYWDEREKQAAPLIELAKKQ